MVGTSTINLGSALLSPLNATCSTRSAQRYWTDGSYWAVTSRILSSLVVWVVCIRLPGYKSSLIHRALPIHKVLHVPDWTATSIASTACQMQAGRWASRTISQPLGSIQIEMPQLNCVNWPIPWHLHGFLLEQHGPNRMRNARDAVTKSKVFATPPRVMCTLDI